MNVEPNALRVVPRRLAIQKVHSRLLPASGWYLLSTQVGDFALTAGALWLAVQLRHRLPFGPELSQEGWPSLHVYLIAPIVVTITYAALGVYRADWLQSIWKEIGVALRATLVSTVLLAGLMYFFDRQTSRWLFFYYGVIQAFLIVTLRLVMHGVCRATRLPLTESRKIAIVGAGPIGLEVAQRLTQTAKSPYRVIGFIDGADPRPPQVDAWPFLGTLDQIESIVQRAGIDELLITLPLEAHDELTGLIEAIHDLPIQVTVIPDYFDLAYLYARSDEMASIPVIRLKEPVLTPWQHAVKRVFDLCLGSLLLILAAPVLLVSALAIRLDSPGPILYRQKRVGENGHEFLMFKLRTMVCDAEQYEHDLIAMQGDSLQFNKLPDDPRVTHVGAFLRRWSIDELPQLFNVLKGNLSLVGPRPELPALVERYSPWQRRRFAVPQGMTGWWQVNGRPQDVEQKVEYDLYYVRNYSVALDLWIMLKTVYAVLSRKGAF